MRNLKTLFCLVLACLPAVAQDTPGRYSPVWLGKGESLTAEQIDKSVAPILAQKPEHLVVMVHGLRHPQGRYQGRLRQSL